MNKNRFQNPDIKKRILESSNLSIAFFLAVIIVFLLGISVLSHSSLRDEKQILTNAINNDIVHCYAVEGFYPPTLEYIEEHYGLSYNTDKYLIDYESIGNNIMPNFMIIERNRK